MHPLPNWSWGANAELVFSSTPVEAIQPCVTGNAHVRFAVSSNNVPSIGIITEPPNLCRFDTLAEDAFRNTTLDVIPQYKWVSSTAVPVAGDRAFVWDLHGKRQVLKRFAVCATGTLVTNSSESAATLWIDQQSDVSKYIATTIVGVPTNRCAIGGNVNLVKVGPCALRFASSVSAVGTIDVREGDLEFTSGDAFVTGAASSWRGATDVTVRGSGRIVLSHGKVFAKTTRLNLVESGKIVLDEGVCQKVGELRVNGVRCASGTWGSSESGARYVDDEHFAGKGLLRVGYGLVVIVR